MIAALSGNSAAIFFLSSCLFAIGLSFQLALNTFYPVPIAELAEAHSYGPAVLLDGAHFGAILCALALFIFGTGSFFICGSDIGTIRKKVAALAKTNAVMQSFLKWINVSARRARFTSLSRQVRGALSPRPRSPP